VHVRHHAVEDIRLSDTLHTPIGAALMELARGLVKENKFKEAQALLRAALKGNTFTLHPYLTHNSKLKPKSQKQIQRRSSALNKSSKVSFTPVV